MFIYLYICYIFNIDNMKELINLTLKPEINFFSIMAQYKIAINSLAFAVFVH